MTIPLVASIALIACASLCLADPSPAPSPSATPSPPPPDISKMPVVPPFKPELGFVSIFNGKDLTGWYATRAMEEQGLQRPGAIIDLDGTTSMANGRIQVINGMIVCGAKSEGETGVFTKKNYRNYILRMQWKPIPQSHPWGLFFDSGVWNRCGHCGHYTQFNIGPDDGWNRNKEWQDEEVVAYGGSVTCIVSGKRITASNGPKPFPDRGPIGLQAETSVVMFRNIEIMVLPDSPPELDAPPQAAAPSPIAAASPSASPAATPAVPVFKPEPGFVSLYNGKDLTGWYATRAMDAGQLKNPGAIIDLDGKTAMPDDRIQAKNGTIVCGGTSTGEAGIFTKKEYHNYVLRVQWKGIMLDPVKNRWFDSGVWNRSGHCGHYTQFNIGPTEGWDKTKEWQTMEVVAFGDAVTCSLNSQRISACDGLSARFPARGPIGLQAEASTVIFRNVEIMELPDSPTEPVAPAASAATPAAPL